MISTNQKETEDNTKKSILTDGMMKVSEAAKFLGLGPSTIYEMIDKRVLDHVIYDDLGKKTPSFRIPRKAVWDYAKRCHVPAAEPLEV